MYHVLNRGNGRQMIFHEGADSRAFMQLLGDVNGAVTVASSAMRYTVAELKPEAAAGWANS